MYPKGLGTTFPHTRRDLNYAQNESFFFVANVMIVTARSEFNRNLFKYENQTGLGDLLQDSIIVDTTWSNFRASSNDQRSQKCDRRVLPPSVAIIIQVKSVWKASDKLA